MNLHAVVGPYITAVNPDTPIGIQVSVGNTPNADYTDTPAYATPGVITASIGGTFTASAAGTTLTVSAVLTGSLQPSDYVSGTDGSGNALPEGCDVVAQLTGTPGGAGTYELSAAADVGPCTVTSASNVLNVTAVSAGLLQPGQTLSDAGALTPGTMITGGINGANGGPGLYSTSRAQTVPSEMMATALTLFAQVQPLAGAALRHVDAMNLQGSHKVVYMNGALRGGVRVAAKGGDLVSLPDGTVWLVTQVLEPWTQSAGWTKALITLQNQTVGGAAAMAFVPTAQAGV